MSPAPPAPFAAPKLLSGKSWVDRTSALGKPRSAPLKALDKAIEAYEVKPSKQALDDVTKMLAAWKLSQGKFGEWRTSARNRKDRAVEHLTALLTGKGDTDTASNEAETFMHPALVHARLGVLFLFGNAKVDSNLFNVVLEGGLGVAGGALSYAGASVSDGGLGNSAATTAASAVSGSMIAGNMLFDAGETALQQARSKPGMSDLLGKVSSYFQSFIAKVWESVKEKLKDWGTYAGAAKAILNACLGAFASAAAPFVSGALDLTKGVVNTLDACFNRYQAWKQGQGVELLSGHPSTIVESIKVAMNLGIGQGLYQSLKGAANLAVTGATAGAGMILNIVVAISEMVIKLIWRLVELSKMKTFFGEAAEHWGQKDNAGAIQTKPFAFAAWYRENALYMPPVSVLTLNSGICGDKMHFLKMFASGQNSSVIGQAEFDRGCAFVDGLKGWGSQYLEKCGYRFSSEQPTVGGLMEFAKKHPSPNNAVWNAVVKMANA